MRQVDESPGSPRASPGFRGYDRPPQDILQTAPAGRPRGPTIMHRRLVVLAALGAALIQGCTGCGQGSSFPAGSVSGRVTSLIDGAPLSGVTVSVALKAPVTTDSGGYYEVKDLPAGNTCRVRFSLQGYVTRFGDG